MRARACNVPMRSIACLLPSARLRRGEFPRAPGLIIRVHPLVRERLGQGRLPARLSSSSSELRTHSMRMISDQLHRGAARSRQTSFQACPDPSRSVRILLGLSGSHQVCPDLARSVRILPGLSGSFQACPDPSRSVRICPGLSGSCQVCLDLSRSVWIFPYRLASCHLTRSRSPCRWSCTTDTSAARGNGRAVGRDILPMR